LETHTLWLKKGKVPGHRVMNVSDETIASPR
jgi:hypothetical protein